MEAGLLVKEKEEEEKTRVHGSSIKITWSVLGEEMKRLGYIAGPMVAVTLSVYLLQIISVMMVGHLGELALSSSSIAMSLCGVTGFSVMQGMRAGLWSSSVPKAWYSFTCARTRAPISMEIFHGIREFFHFAIPSSVMICLEWWSFELLVLLSGLLPNPELETSVLAVCLNTIAMLYSIPYGLGAGVSTRVSSELGAGNQQGACVAVFAVTLLAATEAIIFSGILFATLRVFGYTFSNEKEVVDYVTDMAPLICLSIIMDSLQGSLSGVARGCGWQHIGAYVNLAAFYFFGIPIAAILGFWVQLRGKGLWIGIQAGAILQTILLCIITICTNWEKQATMARERLLY